MAEVAPPPYVSPVATPGDKKTLTKAEEDNLVVALKAAFANIAGESLKINNLFDEVLVALAGLRFIGTDHDLYKDWNKLAIRGRELLVASRDSASTMSATMKMIIKSIIPLMSENNLTSVQKVAVIDKFLAQNEVHIKKAKENSAAFHTLSVDIDLYTVAFETFGKDQLAQLNKDIATIEAKIEELNSKLNGMTIGVVAAGAALAPVTAALAFIPIAGPILAGIFAVLDVIAIGVLLGLIIKTKDEINAKKEELKNLKADKSDLEATQKKLKVMKGDQIDLIKRKLKLFETAWDSVNTACVQIKTYAETGKLMVGLAEEPFIKQAVDLFQWLIICLDGYATGMEKADSAK